MKKQDKPAQILSLLKKHYKRTSQDFVHWKTPLELLMGTVLSAQSTDKQINKITPALFKKYKTSKDYADAKISDLEKLIFSCGFYRVKAQYLKGIGNILEKQYNGAVPNNLSALLTLPGVSHKTAYLVLSKAFHKNVGVAVDTHVLRVAPRLGLTKEKNRDKIAEDLATIFSKKDFLNINEYLILHGRATCSAKPKCEKCFLKELCPSAKNFLQNTKKK